MHVLEVSTPASLGRVPQMLSPRIELADVISRTDALSPGEMSNVDAIVIGAGAAGSTAADELCLRGLKVLVLDAGWQRSFCEQPAHALFSSLLNIDERTIESKTLRLRILWKLEQYFRFLDARRQPVQSSNYAWPTAPDKFVDDLSFPYENGAESDFHWIRCHGPGGRMSVPLHGRQYYRFGPEHFSRSDLSNGDWPIGYADLEPWYEHIEKRLELRGMEDHSQWIPDSCISKKLILSATETEIIENIKTRYRNAEPIMGRFAPPIAPFAVASKQGDFLFRRGAVVSHIKPGNGGRRHSVLFYDRITKSHQVVSAPIVFCCASSLESTRILLQTFETADIKRPHEGGDPLGGNLMDHVSYTLKGWGGPIERHENSSDKGRCIYLPRFDARNEKQVCQDSVQNRFGVRLLRYPSRLGRQSFVATMEGEMLPNLQSRVRLSGRRNAFGIPLLNIDFRYGESENGFLKDFLTASEELVDLFGISVPRGLQDCLNPPGSYIHEMGTARMGSSPSSSVLTEKNELWDFPGIFVTDGSCFVTQGTQHPTLTIMALTARACEFAAASV